MESTTVSVTPELWVGLHELFAELAAAGDRHDVARYVACFTEDAFVDHHGDVDLDNYWRGYVLSRHEGHDGITRHRENVPALPTRSHLLSNLRILSASASVTWTEQVVTVVTPDRSLPPVLRMATYRDKVVRLDDGRSLIAERHIHFHLPGKLPFHGLPE